MSCLDLEIEQTMHGVVSLGLENDEVMQDHEELMDIARRLETILIDTKLTATTEALSVTTESIIETAVSVQFERMGCLDTDVSLESIGEKLKDLWKMIETAVRKSMKTINAWYTKVIEGIEQFRKKTLELKRRSLTFRGYGKDAVRKVKLTGEQKNLFLSSNEKHPGVIAPLKSLEDTMELLFDVEYETTLKQAKDILPRLEINAGDTSKPMDSNTIEDVIKEVKEDLDISGILTNMANPSFKTKVWKVKDHLYSTNEKVRYLHDTDPLAGGKSLAIEGPAYGSFKHDTLADKLPPTSGSLSKVLRTARERTGIRTKLVSLDRSVTLPKAYEGDLDIEPFSIETIQEACGLVIDNLDLLAEYKRHYKTTEDLKEKILAQGPKIVKALGNDPSVDWGQLAAFKQSLLNYHVSRVDNVQNQFLRHAMQVMHSAIKVCEKSLNAYA
jgi:hypothetical protein